MSQAVLKYRAFISYSHADRRKAVHLFRKLEAYRLPKLVVTGASRKLGRFFLDREALAAAHDLSQEILAALAASEILIVICSPAAAASQWVSREIEAFRKLRPGAPILAAIIAGEPDGQKGDPGCFPPVLLQFAEPLAADFRKAGDGPRLGFMKLVAGLSDIPLENLLRRDAVRRNRRGAAILSGAAVVSTAMGALAFTAISARQVAEERRVEAEDMADFMLGDLKDRLEPVGRLDILDGVAAKVLAYYDAQDPSKLDCDGITRQARALHLHTQIEVSKEHLDEARRFAGRALVMMMEFEPRCSNSTNFQHGLGHSHYYAAYPDWVDAVDLINSGQPRLAKPLLEAALSHYQFYQLAIEPLQGLDIYEQENADNNINIGSVYLHLKQLDKAKESFSKARDIIQPVALKNRDNLTEIRLEVSDYRLAINTYANALGWLAQMAEDSEDYTEAIELRESELEQYSFVADELGAKRDWIAYRGAIGSRLAIARLYQKSGEFNLSSRLFHELEQEAQSLVDNDPDNSSWQRLLNIIRDTRQK